MNDLRIPDRPPPPYSAEPGPGEAQRLSVNIPAQARRSMEDERRPLPEGWIRQFDREHEHQYFVDTKTDPPRSIWHHPYDDEDYLATLTSEQREQLQQEEAERRGAQGTFIEEEDEPQTPPPHQKRNPAEAPQSSSSNAAGSSSHAQAAPEVQSSSMQKATFGRRLKDKLTGMTHEERQAERKRRAEEEQRAYELHLKVRRAMNRALETGQPQFVAKDRDGHDIYCEPPQYQRGYGYGGGYGGGGCGPGGSSYRGYNPYNQGVYADPNARFIRPAAPYSRPYGGGYGGGLGLPLAGGLAGGLLLGGLLGGF